MSSRKKGLTKGTKKAIREINHLMMGFFKNKKEREAFLRGKKKYLQGSTLSIGVKSLLKAHPLVYRSSSSRQSTGFPYPLATGGPTNYAKANVRAQVYVVGGMGVGGIVYSDGTCQDLLWDDSLGVWLVLLPHACGG